MVLTQSPILELANTRPDSVDDSGCFVAEPRGEFGVFQVLSFSKHDLRTVQADGLDLQPDFALAGFFERVSPRSGARRVRPFHENE